MLRPRTQPLLHTHRQQLPQLPPRHLIHRRIHLHPRIRHRRQRHTRQKHLQLPHRQIPHRLRPTRRHRRIIQRPQRRKTLTLRTQLRNEPLPHRITQILAIRPPQIPTIRRKASQSCRYALQHSGVKNTRRATFRSPAKIPDTTPHTSCCAPARHTGHSTPPRQQLQMIQDHLQLLRQGRPRIYRRHRRHIRQPIQMRLLRGIQRQRPRHRIQNLLTDVDFAALFKPGQPRKESPMRWGDPTPTPAAQMRRSLTISPWCSTYRRTYRGIDDFRDIIHLASTPPQSDSTRSCCARTCRQCCWLGAARTGSESPRRGESSGIGPHVLLRPLFETGQWDAEVPHKLRAVWPAGTPNPISS